MTTGYYQYPTIHENTIVFVSEDDLWTVPTEGGIARRLTSNLGAVTFPMLSPDGRWLAFVGREEGRSEIYVMEAQGGSARRLTYLSSSCRIVGWAPDGNHIIFCSNYGQIIGSEYGLFTVAFDATDGSVTALDCGPARTIAYGPENRAILGRNIQDSSRWKRYRGGTAGHLWIDRNGDGEFVRFLDQIQGNIAFPMWITNLAERTDEAATRIFFVSDHEGIGNLYSCYPDGTSLRRHTDHEDYYVRNASTDGRRIVYQVGADIYCYDIHDDHEEIINIDYYSPRVQRRRRFVDATRYLDGARLHPKGKAVAISTRGKAFAFFNHEGPVLQYGKREGVRYRLPEWTQDGTQLVLVSDELGEEMIEIHPDDPQAKPRRLEGLDIGRIVAMKVSPVEDRLAIANHRHELLLVDLTKSELTQVDRSPHRIIAGFDWSPDGRWLAYSYNATAKTAAIRLYRLADPTADDEALHESATHTITEPILRDVRPAFDPDGNYLYFLSYREFNPVYDNLHFELGFPWGMRPYLITLRADLPNPFIPMPGDDEDDGDNGEETPTTDNADQADEADVDDALQEPAVQNDEDSGDDDMDEDDDAFEEGADDEELNQQNRMRGRPLRNDVSTVAEEPASSQNGANDSTEQTSACKENKTPPIRIDLAGIERRVLPFPVPDGRYGQIAGVSGKAIFTALPVEAALDDEWDETDEIGTLRCYNFEEFKTETLAEGVSWFQLSRNQKRLLYWGRRRLRVVAAGEKPQSDSGPSRRTGWIDLHRVKVSVEPQQEWEQMFREAWRLQRDHFWTEDMSEVDWQKVYQRYFPLIKRVSTRSEFSDLMWEMQGELGTSHAYEYGGDYRPQPYYSQGFLGTSFTWDEEFSGYRVGALVMGDPWNANESSPLAAPGVDVEPGDLLLAINGQRLDRETPPAQLLVNQAGQDVLLTFAERLTKEEEPEAAKSNTDKPDKGVQKLDTDKNASASLPDLSTEATKSVKSRIDEGNKNGSDGVDQEQGTNDRQCRQTPDTYRTVIVRTIYSEEKARYRAWVNANRQHVHVVSDGRVGYVHIPDMSAHGYAEFHRGYLAEVDRDALIVDVRYNGGGHVSQLILEKLARRRLGYDISRWGGIDPYPADSIAGPIVALTNEHAGSDGDIFCHSFKLMKLGPLVGKRTWGGVVGISPRHALVDGTVTTQPEFSFWFEDVGWNVENYGTEPDIEVDIRPQDYRTATDPQLERAIIEVMQRLAVAPIRRPDLSTRPSRALPQLPPRT